MHHFYPHAGGGPQHDSRCMRGRPGPLLCELHAHTCWSDGTLTVSELVDLYGRNGFDVLCVTDHVVRRDDPWLEVDGWDGSSVHAAHPFDGSRHESCSRLTQRFAGDEALRRLVHRFELFNRTQLFGWVAAAALPAVATGDFHRPEHLSGWKTLVPGPASEEALVEYLRSRRPVYLTRLDADESLLAA